MIACIPARLLVARKVLVYISFISKELSKKNEDSCNIEGADSFLKGRWKKTLSTTLREAVMSEKKPHEKPAPKADKKAEQKTSETVHLSAEELRKISGGAGGTNTQGPGHGPAGG